MARRLVRVGTCPDVMDDMLRLRARLERFMGPMDGKAGLVTGAGSGIGRATAIRFAAEGSRVAVADVDEVGGAETVRLIEELGGEASFVKCDVSDEGQVKDMVRVIMEKWGRLDWAHNNAGLGAPEADIVDQEKSMWEHVLGVDLIGVMLCMKYEVPAMLESGGGAIVNTASVYGQRGAARLTPYSSSKWAVNGLSKSVALEYAARGIRVNSLCPGMTATAAVKGWEAHAPESFRAVADAIPMKRPATTEEQAAAVLWLCSDEASYVTGINLSVDGGMTAT